MKALGHFISTTVHHYHYKHLHYCLEAICALPGG